jgi:hypothetical protein
MMDWDVRTTSTELTGANGIYLTKGLFREFGKESGPYTLSSQNKVLDGKEYISIYQVYMDSVNEYEAAMRIVGNMQHWRKLCTLDWFMNGLVNSSGVPITTGLAQWREDHQMQSEAVTLGALQDAMRNGNVQAAKYLHEITRKLTSPRKAKETPVTSAEDVKVRNLLKRVK